MAKKSKTTKRRKPTVKSSIKKIPGGLDWSVQSRLASTLRRILGAVSQEKEL